MTLDDLACSARCQFAEKSFQLGYSRRVRRPTYNELSPFVTYSDNRNYFSGNPDLNPEFTDSYDFGGLRYLESGITPLSGKEIGSSKNNPFYNSHLLIQTQERLSLQKRFFTKLFKVAECYLVNVGRASDEEVNNKINEIIK